MQAFDNRSEGHSASRSQYLLDLMAKNRAATAVATVAGAAAGGAVAGPFGIAAGMTPWYLRASYATMQSLMFSVNAALVTILPFVCPGVFGIMLLQSVDSMIDCRCKDWGSYGGGGSGCSR